MRKNILITGASSGLGLGMAEEFAAMGRNLVLCARRLDRLQALQKALTDKYPSIRIIIKELDVCAYDDVFTAFKQANEELGGIDRVIVNAGVGKGRPLGTGEFSTNRRIAETNFVAALAQLEAAMEIFRARNAGHVVTIASIAAVRGFPGRMATYAATKAGLAALSESLRAELRQSPIAVTTLYPGFIESEMTANRADTPFKADTVTGVRAMVQAIEQERDEAFVPAWPWALLAPVLKRLPLNLLAKAG